MKNRLYLVVWLYGLLPVAALAQANPAFPLDTVRVGNKTFVYVEQMPVFPGGQAAMYQTIGQNIYYPTEALRQRVEGRVFISFVVGTSGAVQEVKVNKGAHSLLDAEAVRAVEKLPAFVPGKQYGRPVRVAYTIPITFRLPPNVAQILAERASLKPDSTAH